MATISIGIAFGVRLLLVMLFLPFSALDKILDFKGAVRQAGQATSSTLSRYGSHCAWGYSSRW